MILGNSSNLYFKYMRVELYSTKCKMLKDLKFYCLNCECCFYLTLSDHVGNNYSIEKNNFRNKTYVF